MEVYVAVGDQKLGPYTLANLHDMDRMGSFGPEALAWSDGQSDWIRLEDFLARNPQPVSERPKHVVRKIETEPAKPKRLKGLLGAFCAAAGCGLILGAVSGALGILLTILWLPMGWFIGYVGQAWAGKEDQVVGLFAFFCAPVGMYLSVIGLMVGALIRGAPTNEPVMFLGPFGAFMSFLGCLYLAFKGASSA